MTLEVLAGNVRHSKVVANDWSTVGEAIFHALNLVVHDGDCIFAVEEKYGTLFRNLVKAARGKEEYTPAKYVHAAGLVNKSDWNTINLYDNFIRCTNRLMRARVATDEMLLDLCPLVIAYGDNHIKDLFLEAVSDFSEYPVMAKSAILEIGLYMSEHVDFTDRKNVVLYRGKLCGKFNLCTTDGTDVVDIFSNRKVQLEGPSTERLTAALKAMMDAVVPARRAVHASLEVYGEILGSDEKCVTVSVA